MQVPEEVEELKREIARDFPEILKENLVGIYLWGSLTYDAFDEEASDIDCVVVLDHDLSSAEFADLERFDYCRGHLFYPAYK